MTATQSMEKRIKDEVSKKRESFGLYRFWQTVTDVYDWISNFWFKYSSIVWSGVLIFLILGSFGTWITNTWPFNSLSQKVEVAQEKSIPEVQDLEPFKTLQSSNFPLPEKETFGKEVVEGEQVQAREKELQAIPTPTTTNTSNTPSPVPTSQISTGAFEPRPLSTMPEVPASKPDVVKNIFCEDCFKNQRIRVVIIPFTIPISETDWIIEEPEGWKLHLEKENRDLGKLGGKREKSSLRFKPHNKERRIEFYFTRVKKE